MQVKCSIDIFLFPDHLWANECMSSLNSYYKCGWNCSAEINMIDIYAVKTNVPYRGPKSSLPPPSAALRRDFFYNVRSLTPLPRPRFAASDAGNSPLGRRSMSCTTFFGLTYCNHNLAIPPRKLMIETVCCCFFYKLSISKPKF